MSQAVGPVPSDNPTETGVTSYVVRRAGDGDKDELLALYEEVSGSERRARLENSWNWRWHERPLAEQGGYSGVVASISGRIVGSVTWYPACFYASGRPVRAFWQIDSLVHPDHRRRGLAGRMITFGSEDTVMMAKGTSESMLAARLRKGYAKLEPSGEWHRTLSFDQRCQRVLGRVAGRLISPVADFFVREMPKRPASVAPMAGDFGPEFDHLWNTCRDCVVGARDAASLNWRYHQYPGGSYEVLVKRTAQGQLAGYVVVAFFERRSRRRGSIVDLLCGFDHAIDAHQLIAGALWHLKKGGADSVECYATHPVLIGALEECGFRRRGVEPMTMLGNLPEPIHVTAGDGF